MMSTSFPTQTIYANRHNRAALRCPYCGRTKTVQAEKYRDMPEPLKVKCACGSCFHIKIVTPRSTPCEKCDGKGHLFVEKDKKVVVVDAGYGYYAETTKKPCSACNGSGLRYATAKIDVTALRRILPAFTASAAALGSWVESRRQPRLPGK